MKKSLFFSYILILLLTFNTAFGKDCKPYTEELAELTKEKIRLEIYNDISDAIIRLYGSEKITISYSLDFDVNVVPWKRSLQASVDFDSVELSDIEVDDSITLRQFKVIGIKGRPKNSSFKSLFLNRNGEGPREQRPLYNKYGDLIGYRCYLRFKHINPVRLALVNVNTDQIARLFIAGYPSFLVEKNFPVR